MNEIVPDVLTWSRRSERHGYDFNSHLVRHPQGNLCIDPVEPSEAVLDEIAGLGATRVLLTNRNLRLPGSHTRRSMRACFAAIRRPLYTCIEREVIEVIIKR